MSVWTRGFGVTLLVSSRERIEADPGLLRGLLDGIERGRDFGLPETPPDVEWYEVREGGRPAGVALLRRDCPRPRQAALLGVAVAPERRGRAAGTKAVLAAERRLAAEGYAPLLARVPRTNGRGLYFMLRAGFTPVPTPERPDDPGDATWFARRAARRPAGPA